MLKALVKKTLGRLGLRLINTSRHYDSDGLFTIHSDHFRADPVFQAAYRRGIEANNGIDPHVEWRLHVALWAAASAVALPGDFVECGVNTGFMSSAIMCALDWSCLARRFYLLDTFAGPVPSQFSTDEIERGRLQMVQKQLADGAFETSVARVRANFAEWPNAVVVQGAVPDVLPEATTDCVAYLHIDMNCAYPEQQALEYFWNRLSPGALVLLDDYAYYGYDCQRESMDQLGRTLGFSVLSLPTGQGLIVKSQYQTSP